MRFNRNFRGRGIENLRPKNLRKALDLIFNTNPLDPRITFTRASTRTYFDSAGVLSTAAINTPAIDYNPVTLACRGLSIWEARTNLLLRSQEFDNASWTKSDSSVSANAVASPDGTTTADKLVDAATNANHYTYQFITQAANTTNTISVYVKAAERGYVGLQITPDGTNYIYCTFNVSTGTASTPVNAGNGSGAVASIVSVGNGWYRCSLSGIASSTAANPLGAVYVGASNVNLFSNPYSGDGTSGLYIFGAQLEAGSSASPYIPTVASQVTRAADVAVISGANFSSWYNQTEGTFVVVSDYASGPSPSLVATDDGTTNNRIILYNSGGANPVMRIVASGSEQIASGVLGTITQDAVSTVAFGYKVNDCAGSLNGSAVVPDTSVTIPAGQTALRIATNIASAAALNGHIRRITYYPTRLPNATLVALST